MSPLPVQTFTLWTIHSNNWFNREVFTLSARWGVLAVSFLVTFVTAVGASVWSIVVFWLHRAITRRHYTAGIGGRLQDGLFWQIQGALRHATTPSAAIKDTAVLLRTWKNQAAETSRAQLWKILIYAFGIAISAIGAGAAVTLVANPLNKDGSVLLKPGDHCGVPAFDTSSEMGRAARRKWNSAILGNAQNYVQNCYGNSPKPFACSFYPTRKVKVTKSDVPCEYGTDHFGESLCLSKNGMSTRFETDYLGSDTVHGINTGLGDQIMSKKVLTCTPLHAKNLVVETRWRNTTIPVYNFALGPVNGTQPYTYIYNSINSIIGNTYPLYSVSDISDTWKPIAPLRVNNTDASAHFLAANSILYEVPVQGPIFSATNVTKSGSVPPYVPDQYVNAIGCNIQYQLLNPNTGIKSILGSIEDLAASYQSLGLNPFQEALATRYILAFRSSSPYNIVSTLGPRSLLASDALSETISSGLAADQWEREIQNWFEIGLAIDQGFMIEIANNQVDLYGQGYILGPNRTSGHPVDQAAVKLCGLQRVRNIGDYMTFCLADVAITLGVGSVIMLYALFQDSIVHGIERRIKRKNAELMQAWNCDHMSRRLVYDLVPAGRSKNDYRIEEGWVNTDSATPTARKGTYFFSYQDQEEEIEHGQVQEIEGQGESSQDIELHALDGTRAKQALHIHSQVEE